MHFGRRFRQGQRSAVFALVLALMGMHAATATADDHDQPTILGGRASGFDLQALNILSGTGTPALDRALIQELQAQSAFFRLRPAFFVFNSGERTAVATAQVFPQTPGTDGTVLYHLGLLEEHLNSGYWGGSIVAGVIAHEFAHIVQFSDRDLYQRLRSRHGTVKFLELHADFIAGYYMGTKFADNPDDLDTLARQIFEFGDNAFDNVGHHGTPQERHVALMAGFRYYLKNPNGSVSAALTEGEAFVTSVFAAY